MNELPEWAHALAGFDRDDWWLPIVCTDAYRDTEGQWQGRHQPELLALAYADAERSGATSFAYGPHVHLSREPARGLRGAVAGPQATGVLNADGTWSSRPSAARRANASYPGSWDFACPSCTRTPFIPRAKWDQILEHARRVVEPWEDVSRYG